MTHPNVKPEAQDQRMGAWLTAAQARTAGIIAIGMTCFFGTAAVVIALG